VRGGFPFPMRTIPPAGVLLGARFQAETNANDASLGREGE